MRISDWSSDVCSSDLAEAEELPLEWPLLPYTVPASPAEPEHFYRVTMEPEQFADEVGRLQGLWPALDMHLGAAQQSLRPPARALSHWHLAQIGRASCRERVCPYVYISVVAVS